MREPGSLMQSVQEIKSVGERRRRNEGAIAQKAGSVLFCPMGYLTQDAVLCKLNSDDAPALCKSPDTSPAPMPKAQSLNTSMLHTR
jgi:hypothetical protein